MWVPPNTSLTWRPWVSSGQPSFLPLLSLIPSTFVQFLDSRRLPPWFFRRLKCGTAVTPWCLRCGPCCFLKCVRRVILLTSLRIWRFPHRLDMAFAGTVVAEKYFSLLGCITPSRCSWQGCIISIDEVLDQLMVYETSIVARTRKTAAKKRKQSQLIYITPKSNFVLPPFISWYALSFKNIAAYVFFGMQQIQHDIRSSIYNRYMRTIKFSHCLPLGTLALLFKSLLLLWELGSC